MSFAATRQALASTARASLRNTSLMFRASARRMNSSHAAHTPKSDKPWIVASALIFGPAFFYLLSPSARKTTHFVHNDKHDFPGHDAHATTTQESEPEPEPAPESAPEPEPVTMKDDEGTEANITASVKASANDIPKAATPSNEEPILESGAARSEPETKETESQPTKDTSESVQEPEKSGLTDVGDAGTPAKETEPKKAVEAA